MNCLIQLTLNGDVLPSSVFHQWRTIETKDGTFKQYCPKCGKTNLINPKVKHGFKGE